MVRIQKPPGGGSTFNIFSGYEDVKPKQVEFNFNKKKFDMFLPIMTLPYRVIFCKNIFPDVFKTVLRTTNKK